MYQPNKQSYPVYYSTYVQLALGHDLIKKLQENLEEVSSFFRLIPNDLHGFAYQPGKWTPKDILLHLIDTERIFSYRVLKIIRGEGEGLRSFDQDRFVLKAQANNYELSSLIEMYEQVRKSTIGLFKSLSNSQLEMTGSVEGNKISAGAIGFIVLGHELHHQRVIKERYL